MARLLDVFRGPSDSRQRLFALSTIVNTIGMGVFLSAGTIFLVRSAGLSPTTVGVGLTVGSLAGVGAGLLIGDLADRRGAREVLIASMVLEAVASLGLILVSNWWSLIVVAALASVGRTGSVSARGAVIGIIAEEGKGAQLRTYLRAVTNVGLAIGTLGAAAILAFDTRQAYLAMVLTSTLTFLTGASVLVRLPHLPPTRVVNNESGAGRERRWIALRDRHYLGLTAASSVASLQYSVLIQALPVWILLRTSSPRWMAAIVMFLASVLVAAMQVPATRSIDGPRSAARLLARSGPLFLAAWVLMAVASGPSVWIASGLLVVGVVVHSLAEVWQAAGTFELSFALARPEAQGQYQGLIGFGHGLSEAVAPAIVITMCVSGGTTGWIALGIIVTVAGFVCALIERRWATAQAVTSSRTAVVAADG